MNIITNLDAFGNTFNTVMDDLNSLMDSNGRVGVTPSAIRDDGNVGVIGLTFEMLFKWISGMQYLLYKHCFSTIWCATVISGK